jgi:hypothetical protein
MRAAPCSRSIPRTTWWPEEHSSLGSRRSARGLSIEDAIAAALPVNPAADLAALINQLLQAGAFSGLHVLVDKEA